MRASVYTHTHRHTHARTDARTHAHTHTHTHTHTHMHSYIHKHTHCTQAHTLTWRRCSALSLLLGSTGTSALSKQPPLPPCPLPHTPSTCQELPQVATLQCPLLRWAPTPVPSST